VFFVVQGFFSLDEEMLIILAGVVWLDAAGGLFRSVIEKELVYKGKSIRESFVWFLKKQSENVTELKTLHYSRVNSVTEFLNLKEYFLNFSVSNLQKRLLLNLYRFEQMSGLVLYKFFINSGKNEKSLSISSQLLLLVENSDTKLLLQEIGSKSFKTMGVSTSSDVLYF